MTLFSKIIIGVVAAIHVYLGWVEMFAWTTRGMKFLSGLAPETFEPSVILATNMAVYNGFLAAGLVWSLLIGDQNWKKNIALFFLTFISLAGLYGSVTADWKLALVQTVPALVGIISIYLRGALSK